MAASEEIFQCVFIYPVSEKLNEVKSLMRDIAQSVEDDEPSTLLWALHEKAKDPDAPVLVVWEKYENAAAQAIHRQNPMLSELVRVAAEKHLFARPVEIMPLKPLAGKVP